MIFLVGIFGLNNTNYHQKLSAIVQQQADEHSIQKLSHDHVTVYAGFKKDSLYHHEKIYTFENNHGFLVGKIFDDHYQSAKFKQDTIYEIIKNPKLLGKKFWGRYVGILYNQYNKTITLIRDPQGLSTLFYCIVDNNIIFSTDLALLYDLLEEKPTLNYAYFADYLINSNQALSTTPFQYLQELLPNTVLTLSLPGILQQQQLWDISALNYSFISNQDDFDQELLTTMQRCIQAWAAESEGICVELSGGVDSSALMIMLRNILPAEKKLIGVNYIDSKEQSSNEVNYAQEVADMCNVPLYFLDWQQTSLLDTLPTWRPNKPSTFLLSYRMHQNLSQLAAEHNCSEIMNGQGGDHLFLAPPMLETVADYWLEHGFKNIYYPIKELSSMYRMPFFALLKHTIATVITYYRGKNYIVNQKKYTFLDESFIQQFKPQEFYLAKELTRFLPAKSLQLTSLHHAITYADRDQRIPHTIFSHPLLSQPIIELALQIPTYQSFHDGYNRIFLRRAVSRLKTPTALWRRHKGHTTSSVFKQCVLQHQEISDLLMNGKLVTNNIINRQWLNNQLIQLRHQQTNIWPIIHLMCAEVWLKQWSLRN